MGRTTTVPGTAASRAPLTTRCERPLAAGSAVTVKERSLEVSGLEPRYSERLTTSAPAGLPRLRCSLRCVRTGDR